MSMKLKYRKLKMRKWIKRNLHCYYHYLYEHKKPWKDTKGGRIYDVH